MCTRLQRAEQIALVGVDGQHDKLDLLQPAGDLPRRFESVQQWHADIKNGDVRKLALGELDRFPAVGSLGDNFESWLVRQQCAQAGPDQCMIICDKNPYRYHTSSGYVSHLKRREPSDDIPEIE